MSFIAKLQLEDEEMTVLHCGFRFTQNTDTTGRPNSIPQGGAISLVVESNGKNDLFEWMKSPTQMKSGSIIFFRRDNMSKLKTLEFIDAYCVDYYETFDHQGDNPMQIQLTISAHEIKLNDADYKNNWP